MRAPRVLAALGFAAMWIVAVTDAAAQPQTPPSEERCLAAYEQGQRLRLKHALLEARAELLLCARAPCPESFRAECLQWFDQVQELVPSVIIHVEGDVAATDVRVSIDGVLAASRLDGTPIEVDPGEHVFRFEPAGRAPSEQRVLINEGQKARLISISVGAPAAAPTSDRSESSRSASRVPWIFAGVGGLALGSFAYFGATGLSQRDELGRCTPYCEQADIDNTRRRFLAADASLAVSALSFGVALYYWLSASPTTTSTGTVHLDASGGSGSAYVGVRGAF